MGGNPRTILGKNGPHLPCFLVAYLKKQRASEALSRLSLLSSNGRRKTDSDEERTRLESVTNVDPI